MADDKFTIKAEVVDGFSGPMKRMREGFQALANQGGAHARSLHDSFTKTNSALTSTAQTVDRTLNPALSRIGVTSLGVTAAVAGIGTAMRNLGGNLSGLGELSRETGIAADALRTFGGVARKFGIEQGEVQGAVQNFAKAMREMHHGSRETMNWLMSQGRSAGGRKFFQDLAKDLDSTTDKSEQMRMALEAMEKIKDPVEKGIFAQKFFGSERFGRLGDEHLGSIRKLWAEMEKKQGPLNPKAIEQAEQYNRAMRDLGDTMNKMGGQIALQLLPHAEKFATFMDDLVSGKRQDITKPLTEGIKELGERLDKFDWPAFQKSLSETATTAGRLGESIGTIARGLAAVHQAGRDLSDWTDARGLTTPTKDTGRQARATELEKQLADLRKSREDLEAGGPDRLPGIAGGGDRRDRVRAGMNEQEKRLTDELQKLREELKRSREKDARDGTAKAEKSSVEAEGGVAALIHKAAFGGGAGGMAGVGSMLRGGGMGLPGYGQPYADPFEEKRFGAMLDNRGVTGADRDRMMEQFRKRRGGGNNAGQVLSGNAPRGDGSGTRGSAGTADMMRFAMDQLRREGVPEEHLRQAAAHLVGQAHMESGLNPNTVHDQGTGFGIYGARLGRRSKMLAWLKENGYAANSAEGQMRYMAKEAMGGGYARTRRILMGQGTGDLERDTNAITGEFEAPKVINRRSGAVRNALGIGPSAGRSSPAPASATPTAPDLYGEFRADRERLAREGIFPEEGSDEDKDFAAWKSKRASASATGTQGAVDIGGGRIRMPDGRIRSKTYGPPVVPGSANRYMQREAEAEERRKALQLDPGSPASRALRQGTQGATPNVDVQGGVHIQVDPALNARVRTNTTGDLFREVKQSRGRIMPEAI